MLKLRTCTLSMGPRLREGDVLAYRLSHALV
jgi:hypothetical protein